MLRCFRGRSRHSTTAHVPWASCSCEWFLICPHGSEFTFGLTLNPNPNLGATECNDGGVVELGPAGGMAVHELNEKFVVGHEARGPSGEVTAGGRFSQSLVL